MNAILDLGHCIAASSAYRTRVLEQYWLKLYASLNITPPRERIISNAHKTKHYIDLDDANLVQENEAMFPYYNSGVLLVPRDLELVTHWKEQMMKIQIIARDFPAEERDKSLYNGSDQTAFATTIELLKQQGLPFKELPNKFNAKSQEVVSGLFQYDEMTVFHFITFLGMAKK